MLLSFIIWTILNSRFAATQDPEIGKGVLALIFSFSLFFAVGFSPLIYTYVIEIWPYTLRGRGLAFEVSITMFGLILAQFVNPIALKAIGWKYYILFCVLLTIFVTLVYLLFPETKGRTLEEVKEIFDGKVEDVVVVKEEKGVEGVEVSEVSREAIETIR
jgi:MFS family permease